MNNFVSPKNQIYLIMTLRILLVAIFAPLMLNAAHDHNGFDRNEDPNLKVFVKTENVYLM